MCALRKAFAYARQYACPTLKMTVSDNNFIPSFLKSVTPFHLSFLSAEYHFSYFTKKIKAIKREFSPTLPTLPTHLPTGSVCSPVTLDKLSLLLSKVTPAPRWIHPIFSHLLKFITLAISPTSASSIFTLC